jgi:hypothetical protein
VNEERLNEVVGLRSLRSLTLIGIDVDAKSLTKLAGLKGLERLTLAGRCEDLAALTAVVRSPKMETMDLQKVKAERGIEPLKAACPGWVSCAMPEEEVTLRFG